MSHVGRGGRFAIVAFVVGLAATGALSVATHSLYERNEASLLNLQVRQAGEVVTAAAASIATPLAATTAIVNYSGGYVGAFDRAASALVGSKAGEFASLSLWQLDRAAPRLVASVGQKPLLNPSTPGARAFFAGALHTSGVAVNPSLGGRVRRLGYAETTRTGGHELAVYGERPLESTRVKPDPTSPFADLDYAIYLGRAARPGDLVVQSVARLPLPGRTDALTVPFGNASLTIVASGRGSLASFGANVWWVVAVVGAVLSAAGALTVMRLDQLRGRSDVLAAEAQARYRQQRDIAETLQRGLLPARLPTVAGLEVAARYVPGVEGLEVGGDWYSAIERDDHRIVFIVGDVAGRGVRAATVMASLRFTVRTYALEGYEPSAVLERCARVLDFGPGEFATVVCGVIDLEAGMLSIANAGHMPLLLVEAAGARYISVPPGPPIGVTARPSYETATVPLPPAWTLIGYTDGLVERRGESLDVGLARLSAAALASNGLEVEGLLDSLLAELAPSGPVDDIALIGLRWISLESTARFGM
jgi:hypothetical protein